MRPAAIFRNMYTVGATALSRSVWSRKAPNGRARCPIFPVGHAVRSWIYGRPHPTRLESRSCRMHRHRDRPISLDVRVPTIRETMSFSDHGMPPYMAEAAAMYRHENHAASFNQGWCSPAVPPPHNQRSSWILAVRSVRETAALPGGGVVGALVPSVFAGLIAWAHKKRRWDSRIQASLNLVLIGVPVTFLLIYGRVSFGSSLALRVGTLVLCWP